jgi:hypothetical protein
VEGLALPHALMAMAAAKPINNARTIGIPGTM